MIQISPTMRLFACLETVDFRKGIDGLAATCRTILNEDPFSGALFLFKNRTGTTIKALFYDGQGFWLCTKRLSKGKFHWWPKGTSQSPVVLQAHELQTLLWNGNPSRGCFSEAWKKIVS
jgi:transposase